MEKNLTYTIKTYTELNKDELYAILRLRAEVFVVEQDCPYQDVDNKDQKAVHILGYKNESLVAYTRIFKPGGYFENASIGRVVVAKKERQYGYGKELMQQSINEVIKLYGNLIIEISAQEYLRKFYNELGFVQQGEGYLEDNIPHIRMFRIAK
ncbi:GNAT family N-acetyltransferase [Flavimarina sp. Hel_I_48]|uniref:GNAT family N-acetyltransferase n=1 Tax=Flavimarina sp. Hel_I_48 TaxID=1392488 RepID=UPI0004DFA71A|nr:GNAT family N-acetyltransferase [Flavimarina sp. Hel_I_48]